MPIDGKMMSLLRRPIQYQSIIHLIVKLLVFIWIMSYMIKSKTIDVERLSTLLKLEIWGQLLLIGVLYEALKGLRLKIVFENNDLNFSMGYCLKLIYITHFFNHFFWGQAGGFVSKVIYVATTKKASTLKIARAFFLEVYVGLLSALGLLLIFMAAVSFSDYSFQKIFTLTIAIVFALSILLVLSSRLLKKISFKVAGYKVEELINLKVMRDWRVYALFAATYSLKALLLLVAGRAIYGDKALSYLENYTVFLGGQFISLIPTGPSGAGAGHLGFNFLAQNLSGMNNDYGADIFSAFWMTHFIFALLGGIIFLIAKRNTTDEILN